jgi:ATP-dependent exoDNAse (exonuclease V) alpha subunit
LANRELGKVEGIDASGNVGVKADSGRTATFSGEHKHLDHGYAVTSHSAQGTTADRVIVHAESSQSSALVNQRFAYVGGSRARDDLQVYTDDARRLASALDRPFDKIVFSYSISMTGPSVDFNSLTRSTTSRAHLNSERACRD